MEEIRQSIYQGERMKLKKIQQIMIVDTSNKEEVAKFNKFLDKHNADILSYVGYEKTVYVVKF